jgi:hypothetical protein
MKTIRYCILAVLLMILASAIFQRMTDSMLPYRPAALFPEPQSWTEVGRKVLLDQSWEMTSAAGWVVPGVTGDPTGLRLWIEGSFSSSDPGVKLAVMDQKHYQGWESGYPALESGMAVPDQHFRLGVPTAGYYFGFFPPAPSIPRQIPTSSMGVAMRLLQVYAQAHPAPIRITAHVELVVESFCTPEQAVHEREVFLGAQK